MDEFAVVQVNADTGGGTQDVIDSRITDFEWGIVLAFGTTANGTPADHARVSVGFFNAAGEVSVVSSVAQDGGSSIQAFNRRSNARCISVYATSGTGGAAPVASASVVDRATSGLANGIRLSWDVTPDAAYRLVFLLVGGSPNSIVRAALVDGTDTIGFQADLAVGAPGVANTAGGEGSAQNGYHSGLALARLLGTILQAAGSNALNRDITGPFLAEAGQLIQSSRFGAKYAAGGNTVATEYAIDSITATQVVASTPVGATPQMPVVYAELDDPTLPVAVVIESLDAAFSGVEAFSGFGFHPQFVLGLATLVTGQDSNDTSDLAASHALFLWDSDGQWCGGTRRDNNVSASDASTLFDAVALVLMDESGAEAVRATLSGFKPYGFDLNFSSAADGQLVLLGIGFPQAQPPPPRRRPPATKIDQRPRRIRAPVGGKAPKSGIVTRILARILRMRRQDRLRRAARPLPIFHLAPPHFDAPPERKARGWTSGLRRGRLSGPGVPRDED